ASWMHLANSILILPMTTRPNAAAVDDGAGGYSAMVAGSAAQTGRFESTRTGSDAVAGRAHSRRPGADHRPDPPAITFWNSRRTAVRQTPYLLARVRRAQGGSLRLGSSGPDAQPLPHAGDCP